jgi:hypothetical protein
MGWWIIVSGLTFILAAILACGSVLPTSELVRAALDVVAILSGMVCVGLGARAGVSPDLFGVRLASTQALQRTTTGNFCSLCEL